MSVELETKKEIGIDRKVQTLVKMEAPAVMSLFQIAIDSAAPW